MHGGLPSTVKTGMIEMCATVFTREFPTFRQRAKSTRKKAALPQWYAGQNKIKIKKTLSEWVKFDAV